MGTYWGYFIGHLPGWTLILSLAVLSVSIVLLVLTKSDITTIKKSLIVLVLVEYLFLMFCSTVGCRTSQTELIEPILEPFWNYTHIFINKDYDALYEILYNIVLYMPIGVLLSWLNKLKLSYILLTGFVISFIIECLQFILHRGFFETDDIIHNTIGTLLGYLIFFTIKKCNTIIQE